MTAEEQVRTSWDAGVSVMLIWVWVKEVHTYIMYQYVHLRLVCFAMYRYITSMKSIALKLGKF